MTKAEKQFKRGLKEIQKREDFAIGAMDFEGAVVDDMGKPELQLRIELAEHQMEHEATKQVGENG